MTISRRKFIKLTGTGMGGLLLSSQMPVPVQAKPSSASSEKSAAMLYDATICVGCRACQNACKHREDRSLPPETDNQSLYEIPRDLSASTWTLIKLYKPNQDEWSFVKAQCMHCVEPACVSGCPVGALEKLESGPVIYHPEKCIGCRYCMLACPYHVPKYQWSRTDPLIQKCDFCAARQAQGQDPACSEACPTGALIYGKRSGMLSEAHRRLDSSPDKYVNYVYGEDEVGGASMLYISHVPFEKLGFPTLDKEPISHVTWPYMLAVPGIIVIVGALMSGLYMANHRDEHKKEA